MGLLASPHAIIPGGRFEAPSRTGVLPVRSAPGRHGTLQAHGLERRAHGRGKEGSTLGPHDPPGALATLILPTYNAAAFVAETVSRLRAFLTRHPEWRVLFVCDGCTDGTEALLQDLGPGFDLVAYGGNRGKGFAIRTGFGAARDAADLRPGCVTIVCHSAAISCRLAEKDQRAGPRSDRPGKN